MSLVYNVQVQGNIKNSSKLSVKLHIPHFFVGAWMLAVSTIAYQPKENNINVICNVSTNLIKSQKYTTTNRLEFYHPTICTVLLKANITDLKVIQLDPIWYTVNDVSDTLEIDFNHFELLSPILHNTFLSVNVLIKRVI